MAQKTPAVTAFAAPAKEATFQPPETPDVGQSSESDEENAQDEGDIGNITNEQLGTLTVTPEMRANVERLDKEQSAQFEAHEKEQAAKRKAQRLANLAKGRAKIAEMKAQKKVEAPKSTEERLREKEQKSGVALDNPKHLAGTVPLSNWVRSRVRQCYENKQALTIRVDRFQRSSFLERMGEFLSAVDRNRLARPMTHNFNLVLSWDQVRAIVCKEPAFWYGRRRHQDDAEKSEKTVESSSPTPKQQRKQPAMVPKKQRPVANMAPKDDSDMEEEVLAYMRGKIAEKRRKRKLAELYPVSFRQASKDFYVTPHQLSFAQNGYAPTPKRSKFVTSNSVAVPWTAYEYE